MLSKITNITLEKNNLMPFAQGCFCIFLFVRTMELLHYPCHSNFLALELGA
jgi:hypothetical protein